MIYEVHDDEGKLRVFYSKQQAERFLQPWQRIVTIKEPTQRKQRPDLSKIAPAPF